MADDLATQPPAPAGPVLSEGKVQLRSTATGQAFEVDPAEAEQALAGGDIRLETPEEFATRQTQRERSTLGQKALTAGEGALRGATMGLGTAAAAAIGGREYREGAKERAAVNPELAVGSEIAGSVLPALFSGGAGAAGTVARAMPVSLAGRAGLAVERGAAALTRRAGLTGEGVVSTAVAGAIRGGAGSAAETALYGLGSSLADSALDGVDWTAERALSGLKSGGIIGGKIGAALGGGRVVGGRLAATAAREIVDTMVSGGQTFRRAVEDWAEERATTGIARGDDARAIAARITDDGASPERLERIATKLREAGVESSSRADMVTVARAEAQTAAKKYAAVADELAASGARPDAAAIRARINATREAIATSGTPGAKEAAARLDRAMKKPLAALERELGTDIKRGLLEAEALQVKLNDIAATARKQKMVVAPELEKLAGAVSSHIDDVAGPAGATVWKAARQEAHDWRLLTSKLGKIPLSDGEVGRMIGVGGTVASVATGSVVPYLVAAGIGQNPAVRQFARERGGVALSWLASRSGWVERTVRSSAKRMAGAGPGEAAGIVKRGLTHQAIDIAEGVATQAPAARRGVIESVQTYQSDRQRENRRDFAERYAGVAAAVQKLNEDPEALAAAAAQLVAPIVQQQPEVAMAMMQRHIADQQYLASKLPPPAPAMSVLTKTGPPLASRGDQRKFLRYFDALDDPPAAIEALSHGEINFEAADALRDRRPGVWESFKVSTLANVAQAEKPLSYKRRAYLSLLFGVDLDPSLTPEGSAAIQQSLAPAEGESSGGAPSQLDPAAVGQKFATPSQQAEAR